MTTFATVNDNDLFVQYVQSSDAIDLRNRVTAALAAILPTGRLITGVTLAGAGDGYTFVVEITSALPENIISGSGIPPTFVVRFYMAADAAQLAVQRARIATFSAAIGDEQIVGSSKGTRFMGMYLAGTPFQNSEGAVFRAALGAPVPVTIGNPGVAVHLGALDFPVGGSRWLVMLNATHDSNADVATIRYSIRVDGAQQSPFDGFDSSIPVLNAGTNLWGGESYLRTFVLGGVGANIEIWAQANGVNAGAVTVNEETNVQALVI